MNRQHPLFLRSTAMSGAETRYGVYILMKAGLPQYVGCSKNPTKRVYQHQRLALIDFDEVRFLPVRGRPSTVCYEENELIRELQPRFNVLEKLPYQTINLDLCRAIQMEWDAHKSRTDSRKTTKRRLAKRMGISVQALLERMSGQICWDGYHIELFLRKIPNL